MRDALADFFRLESAGGICLVAAAVLAMVVANSPLVVFYDLIFSTAFEVRLGDFGIAKPLLLWVNDGLMAVFFFLVGLAIFDDLGAIIIIAIFYTANVSLTVLAVASLCLVALLGLNRRGVTELTPYLLIGLIMWTAVLKSGVHATLAGVALALFIPMRDPNHPERSPVRDLEHDLHTAVAFGILPIFAFANAGISLAGTGWDALFHTVPLGIAAGLVVGKQVGIILGSLISGLAGYAVLRASLRPTTRPGTR